jgi:hypothetical protein
MTLIFSISGRESNLPRVGSWKQAERAMPAPQHKFAHQGRELLPLIIIKIEATRRPLSRIKRSDRQF